MVDTTMLAGAQSNFVAQDDYPLMQAPPGCPYRTETFNLWLYDAAQKIGLNAHLVSSGGDFSRFDGSVTLFDGPNILANTLRGDGVRPDGPGAGNLFGTILEPLKSWRYDYLGILRQTTSVASAGGATLAELPPVLVGFELMVEMATPPIEQGSQGDRGVKPSSGTIARDARRYEQLCRVRGPLRIGSRTIMLDALGMRVHRRNSKSIYASGAVGHTWACRLFPSGRGFHLLAHRAGPEAVVNFCYGHYFDGERYHQAEVLKFPHFSGVVGDESYELVLRTDERTIVIQGHGIAPYLSVIPDALLSRSPGHFTMDGEVGGGIFERSLGPAFRAGGYFTLAGPVQ